MQKYKKIVNVKNRNYLLNGKIVAQQSFAEKKHRILTSILNRILFDLRLSKLLSFGAKVLFKLEIFLNGLFFHCFNHGIV